MLYDIILTLNGVARQAETLRKPTGVGTPHCRLLCFLFIIFLSLDMDGMASITAQVVWDTV